MTLRQELDPHPPRQSRASLGKLTLTNFENISSKFCQSVSRFLVLKLKILEVEAARLKREQIENQISKNFKSRPVPAETYYPLYHDILLQSESRRQLVLENRRQGYETG